MEKFIEQLKVLDQSRSKLKQKETLLELEVYVTGESSYKDLKKAKKARKHVEKQIFELIKENLK